MSTSALQPRFDAGEETKPAVMNIRLRRRRAQQGGSNSTRIAYVEGNPDGTIGGSFFSLLYLIEGLDRSIYEPVVIFARANTMIERFRRAGAAVHVLPIAAPVVLGGIFGRIVSKLANFLLGFVIEPLRLATFVHRERITFVHLNNSIIRNHAWALAALVARVPCVTHERGINAYYSPRSLWIGRRLDAVICISTAVHDNFIARGVSGLPLITIPNGLDPAQMRVTRDRESICRELGVSPSSRVVGIVGNIKYWKGQDVVVRAIASLRREFPDLVCLLVGDSSPSDFAYRQRVDSLISELGLQSVVVTTGYRPNVPDYLATMEVLIHASTEPEPFGRVLLEAMALSKPIVASRGGGVPEIVQNGKTGFLFSPGDYEGLSTLVADLLRDPVRAQEMGRAGYQRLLADFGIRSNIERTERLYASILGS